jgi:hypothetical protein
MDTVAGGAGDHLQRLNLVRRVGHVSHRLPFLEPLQDHKVLSHASPRLADDGPHRLVHEQRGIAYWPPDDEHLRRIGPQPSRHRTAGGYRGSQASIRTSVGTCRTGITRRAERATRTRRGVIWSPGSRRPRPRPGRCPGPTARTCRGRGRSQLTARTKPADRPGHARPPGPRPHPRTAQGPRGDEDARGTGGVEGIRGFDDEGVRGAFDADGVTGAHAPDVIQGARERRTAAHGTRARRIRARRAPQAPARGDDEHFIPPPPPPLPKLDPVTKGAWAALFGGPGYLVVATAAGWSVPGIAAFCAVAAFVTGFAILVLRMNDSPGPGPDGPDDGDDGAVV